MAKLNLITLPIGNKNDLTIRAKETLEKESFFLAEDTRVFRSFLKQIGIEAKSKKVISFHDYSTKSKICELLKNLEDGVDLFLVSDAGSPVISDPAYMLVREVVKSGFEICSFPGVTSVIVALELSGLPTDPFFFYGFLPREQEKKRTLFQSFLINSGTYIFFESPVRVLKTLKLISEELENSDVVVARELTKKFETIHRFKASDLSYHKEQIITKGEFVILVHIPRTMMKKSLRATSKINLESLALEYIEKGGSKKLLAKILAGILDERPKEIYSKLTIER